MSRALYSIILLKQGSINEKTWGRTLFCGGTNTIPTLAITWPLGPILDAPSKNIRETFSSEVILFDLIQNVFVQFLSFWNRMSCQKICEGFALYCLLRHKGHVIFRQQNDPINQSRVQRSWFIMRMHQGLTFETTCMVWPTIQCRVFWIAKMRARYSFSTGLYRDSAPIEFCSSTRWPVCSLHRSSV